VSITPPQVWVETEPFELREGVEELPGQPGKGRGPLVLAGRDQAAL